MTELELSPRSFRAIRGADVESSRWRGRARPLCCGGPILHTGMRSDRIASVGKIRPEFRWIAAKELRILPVDVLTTGANLKRVIEQRAKRFVSPTSCLIPVRDDAARETGPWR